MEKEQSEISVLRAEIENLHQRVRVFEAELAKHEQTERALREEHSFREAVIERAAEGVCVCHYIPTYPHIQFTVWNTRMTIITGYTIEEINRLGWYQTVYSDPEVQKKARERMESMRQGEDLRYERWEITRPDGQKRTLGISTSILTTDDGFNHVLALMHDVTEEEKYRKRLESKVMDLQDLLPICASCKKVRDDSGYWQQVERYIGEHFKTQVTHGICPECSKKLYPEFSR